MDLKDKIKYYREKKHMTKSELSRKIGVSPSYITKLENGEKTNPSLEIQIKIAKTLEIPLNELINSIQSGVSYRINTNVDFKIIKEYREKMGISQKDLSTLIGIKLEDLKGIEAGEISNPRIDYAVRLNSLFKPEPPFCYECINESVFAGTGGLIEGFNEFINNGVSQSTNCRMDKILILKQYIRRLAEDKNIELSNNELNEIVNFLSPVIDPLLEHKLNEIIEKHKKQ